MPMDLSAVGTEFGPVERSWTSKDNLLYAIGVGAGLDDLPFCTENSKGIPQQVLPTFAVIHGMAPGGIAEAGTFNFGMLVHGEQAITVNGPIPVDGKVNVTGKLAGIYDKGSGALVVTEGEARDTETGELRFTAKASFFIRGEGGFGGPKSPESTAPSIPADRDPDHVVSYTTREDQALTYRLSGDRNPLHSDPGFATAVGFPKPILHGLCTYGFTGRALLSALCGNDPATFTGMSGRFSKPVYPGDTLTVSMWVTGDSEAVFRTTTQEGTIVIDGGHCTFQ